MNEWVSMFQMLFSGASQTGDPILLALSWATLGVFSGVLWLPVLGWRDHKRWVAPLAPLPVPTPAPKPAHWISDGFLGSRPCTPSECVVCTPLPADPWASSLEPDPYW